MLPNRKVTETATGRWPSILMHFGVHESFLKNKHGPCPVCDGKDRYRFDNREGRGTFICSHCGSGDGFKLLELLKGWSFKEAAYNVEQIVGGFVQIAVKSEDDEAKKINAVKRIWTESERVTKGDPVWLYLHRRIGIDLIPACLRFHPALPYVEDNDVTYHPALVAAVTNDAGAGVGVHRIYLTSAGEKAPVEKGKKLMAGKPLSGASIKLSSVSEEIGIAEGIETALAASRRFGFGVWAAISANLMEQWIPPQGVKRVVIFGDNDASFTGQAASFGLAKKLVNKGFAVDVRIPEGFGKDWADQ